MKVEDVLKKLDYDELEALFEDLKHNGIKTRKQISERMKNIQQKEYCAICLKEITNEDNSFTLMFGPENMKMKATFCEVDCLLTFISRLKNVKNDKTFSQSLSKIGNVKQIDENSKKDRIPINKFPSEHKKNMPSFPKLSFE